jgi:hypothetical protein
MSCRKLTLLFEGEEAKCHTCGGHGEVLSAEQFEKGHASGVFFGIGPKGKRTKVEPGQQLLVKWNLWAREKGLTNANVTDDHRYEFFQSIETVPYLLDFVRAKNKWKGVMGLLRRPLIY